MGATRPYTMRARADTTAAMRARILAAGRALAFDELELEPSLGQVAAAARTTPQTVLRHFGSRGDLLSEIERSAREEIAAERRPRADGVDSALTALLGHYELRGDFVLALIAKAAKDPRAAQIAEHGRLVHRAWVADVFAGDLPGTGPAREEALDLLVVATDLFTWRLLRRDLHLPLATVTDRMRALIAAILHP